MLALKGLLLSVVNTLHWMLISLFCCISTLNECHKYLQVLSYLRIAATNGVQDMRFVILRTYYISQFGDHFNVHNHKKTSNKHCLFPCIIFNKQTYLEAYSHSRNRAIIDHRPMKRNIRSHDKNNLGCLVCGKQSVKFSTYKRVCDHYK